MRAAFETAVADLDALGMPTRYLETVAAQYEFFGASEGAGSYVRPVLDNLYLDPDTTRQMGDISDLESSSFASSGVQTLYHEAAHAYVDLVSDEPAWATFIAEGEAHYQDAPLSTGDTANDPHRVFHEAVAAYVGHRAAAYHGALSSLSTYRAMLRAGEVPAESAELLRGMVQERREEYDRATARRVFGYQALTFGGQTDTTRPMTDEMAAFLDTHVLDNALPPSFSEAPALLALQAEVLALVETLEASAFVPQGPPLPPPPADPLMGPTPLP